MKSTWGNKNIYWRRLRVRCWASIVSWVLLIYLINYKSRMCFWSWIGLHRDAVHPLVIDYLVIMMPIYILRGIQTLKIWNTMCFEILSAFNNFFTKTFTLDILDKSVACRENTLNFQKLLLILMHQIASWFLKCKLAILHSK